ncbi:hypothetical protein ACRE_002110 [Hapsidospora chrysogenum ATCC 11550]|uniref:Uncharacterized protein n=1 Tax=Hapsidospora chrysogenum (strain ATCC 11550 / CBS 779.69 / DSM 880 / IAM 14645 / JCM 23072 / IMI 49137) TaxID=857340 RepID=A0A086THM0_HAPC1|nr:hypothetical protein ACRE_002110 [Hapsidospora chrysogenum ATCC 11550]
MDLLLLPASKASPRCQTSSAHLCPERVERVAKEMCLSTKLPPACRTYDRGKSATHGTRPYYPPRQTWPADGATRRHPGFRVHRQCIGVSPYTRKAGSGKSWGQHCVCHSAARSSAAVTDAAG